MMSPVVSFFAMVLTAALAFPAFDATTSGLADADYYSFEADKRDFSEQIIPTQKRAALVLDRLLIALQKALHEESANQRAETDRDGPRAAPLRVANMDNNDVTGLQRRGQGTSRGRVLRCYFNAITCF